MSSISTFRALYGAAPWKDFTLYWTGTATSWSLFQVGNPVALYTGTNLNYAFTGVPGARYDFRLEGTLLGVKTIATIPVFTRACPAPMNLAAGSTTDVGTTLTWDAVAGATSYDVADANDNYTVLYTVVPATKVITGLTPLTHYGYAVRATVGGVVGKWSSAVSVTTSAAASVTAGVYSYPPAAIGCWQAGKAGSTSPAWRAATTDWFHGEGSAWGDNSGVLSTWFFFGGVNPFAALTGGTVTKCEIYMMRADYGGDPGAVLSRWLMHAHTVQPGGAPVSNGTEYDAGTYARGEGGWVTVPNAWATALIGGGAKGIGWGGVAERYEVMRYVDSSANPRPGTVRITVS